MDECDGLGMLEEMRGMVGARAWVRAGGVLGLGMLGLRYLRAG